MLKLLERLMLQLVDGILVIDTKNSYLKDRYKMYCSNVKSTKNVPLSKPLSSKHKINSTIFTVIYVGRIAEKRGVLTLARAVIYMINNGEEVKLITIGKDINNTKNKIRHIFEANNSRKHLKMEPPVPYEEVHRKLAHGDVALAPYTDTWEYQQARGNSRKIFDYMMAGIPIIGPDFSGIGQLIKDIDSGLVVDTTSKVAIAEAILKLKNDPELCEKYSRNGRKAIEQTYNWSVESERLLNVVDKS
jgi:glycosyltransferase involved in cell wall biosynthesis